MKKAFTLIELLVVITVIGIMMGMVMRFTRRSDDVRSHNLTVSRLQRLENALSGYYAAYGTYPPVRLHGTRNIYRSTNNHGVQSTDSSDRQENLWGWVNRNGKVTDAKRELDAWNQVQAACESQPVACNFPYPDDNGFKEYVQAIHDGLAKHAETIGQEKLGERRYQMLTHDYDVGDPQRFNAELQSSEDWMEIQVFRFGLMSYLLPRYLFMMQGAEEFLEFAQWTGNNKDLRNPFSNARYSWTQMRRDVDDAEKSDRKEDKQRILAAISSLSSQAVCARWMANFEKSLTCARAMSFYGVDVRDDGEFTESTLSVKNINLKIYTPGGFEKDSYAGQYVLDGITITDGWGTDFFYYSPSPHQSYVVWSAGPNKRTFPPWIPRESLSEDANRCVNYWIRDDIVGLRQ